MMDAPEFLRERALAMGKVDGWGASRGPAIPT